MIATTTNIGWVGFVSSLVLAAVAVVVSVSQGLGSARSILWSCPRATVQLLIVGVALKPVLDPSQPLLWSWVWARR